MEEGNMIRISDAEWAVLHVLWESNEDALSAAEVANSLKKSHAWSSKTVRTLIDRLVRKKIVLRLAADPVILYAAAVSAEACQIQAADSFLGRVFSGSALPMIAQFVERGKLTNDEIEELREILRKADSE